LEKAKNEDKEKGHDRKMAKAGRALPVQCLGTTNGVKPGKDGTKIGGKRHVPKREKRKEGCTPKTKRWQGKKGNKYISVMTQGTSLQKRRKEKPAEQGEAMCMGEGKDGENSVEGEEERSTRLIRRKECKKKAPGTAKGRSAPAMFKHKKEREG